MKRYHIGLDFGTYQTKACVYDRINDIHEFVTFPTTGSFFIPSRIGKRPDDTFEYGVPSSGTITKDYYYFKIAAAEDLEFQFETFSHNSANPSTTYKPEEFRPYTPEFLSTIYITYLLFVIKQQYQSRGSVNPKKGKLLSRLLKQSSEEQVQFTVQIGIPTEWSQQKNLKRKKKFENILRIAELLQNKFITLENFEKANATQLIDAVKNIYKNFTFQNADDFYKELHQLGISVFPETAAGLTFIVKTKQLLPGHYAIMDIGGGSTDISFFIVESGNTIKYLASESYIIASNNVYKRMCNGNYSISAIHEVEKEVHTLLQTNDWKKNKSLNDALLGVNKDLNKLVYKLFNKRIHHYRKSRTQQYDGQPILLYGGGSRLPFVKSGYIEIHDNGLRVITECVCLEKQSIDQFASAINVLPKDKSWLKELSVLVVALGLSYIKPDSFADWFGEDDYHSEDGVYIPKGGGPGKWNGGSSVQVPHPHNEDCYIYDVLASKWH